MVILKYKASHKETSGINLFLANNVLAGIKFSTNGNGKQTIYLLVIMKLAGIRSRRLYQQSRDFFMDSFVLAVHAGNVRAPMQGPGYPLSPQRMKYQMPDPAPHLDLLQEASR
jgi:hypothetical protein